MALYSIYLHEENGQVQDIGGHSPDRVTTIDFGGEVEKVVGEVEHHGLLGDMGKGWV